LHRQPSDFHHLPSTLSTFSGHRGHLDGEIDRLAEPLEYGAIAFPLSLKVD
jgi:hypothetical protein